MNIDLSAYIKAGYAPVCHCRLDSALEYIKQQLELDARANNETIEVEIAPGLWAPSGYYWEEDTLFKKE